MSQAMRTQHCGRLDDHPLHQWNPYDTRWVICPGSGTALLELTGAELVAEHTGRYAGRDHAVAFGAGLDEETYTLAVNAAWSNLNPQTTPRVRAESVALAVLLAIKEKL